MGHGPPVPPCSYTYEHNGDIRHKQMYIQSLSIWRGLANLFLTGRSLSSRPWRVWPRSPLHLAVQFTPRPAECPRMRRSRFSGDKRHYLTAPDPSPRTKTTVFTHAGVPLNHCVSRGLPDSSMRARPSDPFRSYDHHPLALGFGGLNHALAVWSTQLKLM